MNVATTATPTSPGQAAAGIRSGHSQAESKPRAATLEPTAQAEAHDRHDGRIDVHDDRGERDRDDLEARVIRAGIRGVEDSQRYGHDRGSPVEQPQSASPVRPGQDPEPGEYGREAESPGRQDLPAHARLVDRLCEQPARAESAGRNEHEEEPERPSPVHSPEPSRGARPLAAASGRSPLPLAARLRVGAARDRMRRVARLARPTYTGMCE